MRMLLDITIPHEPFNSLARQKAAAGKKLGEILDATKPEAIYFTEQDGKRGAIVVIDIPNPSKIPRFWPSLGFLLFNADVKCRIAMTLEDLKKSGLDALGKKWA